jgi:hypothetical protein
MEYLSEGNEFPKIDPRQDWNLIEGKENGTHTTLKFFRAFDTCDDKDIQIGNDTSNVIWAFGETDVLGYHAEIRGNIALNLLDPPTPEIDTSNTQIWRISSDFEMPSDDTTYWCTMHKSPALPSKHHAIGFEAYLPSKEAKDHTHHFIVHECQKNPGAVEAFEELMASPGDHCYKAGKASKALQHCQSFMVVWATGGKRAMFPENVGIPIGETKEVTYYMLQIHYNNPQRLKGVKFDAGVEIFYTENLREFEGTTLTVGHSVLNTHIIPPKTKSFTTVGHCSSECTQSAFPESGINIFNVMLHSHLGGRKMKLRHFRNGQELPWIAYDNNYNFNFQQNRPMRESVKVLPGDQLAIECVYETTTRENVTIGGFATEEEMCQGFVLYYPRTDVWICASHFPYGDTLKEFGIEKMEFVQGSTNPKVTEPPQHAGKRFTDVLNEIDWTPEKVKDLQEKVRFSKHTSRCGHIKGVQTVGKPMASNATVTYQNLSKEFALGISCG